MAVTVTSFLVEFPEFQDAPTTLIQAALDNALLLTPADQWGALQDMGTSLRAAQELALSPYGRNLAFSDKDGTTVYDERLRKLVTMIGLGGYVI